MIKSFKESFLKTFGKKRKKTKASSVQTPVLEPRSTLLGVYSVTEDDCFYVYHIDTEPSTAEFNNMYKAVLKLTQQKVNLYVFKHQEASAFLSWRYQEIKRFGVSDNLFSIEVVEKSSLESDKSKNLQTYHFTVDKQEFIIESFVKYSEILAPSACSESLTVTQEPINDPAALKTFEEPSSSQINGDTSNDIEDNVATNNGTFANEIESLANSTELETTYELTSTIIKLETKEPRIIIYHPPVERIAEVVTATNDSRFDCDRTVNNEVSRSTLLEFDSFINKNYKTLDIRCANETKTSNCPSVPNKLNVKEMALFFETLTDNTFQNSIEKSINPKSTNVTLIHSPVKRREIKIQNT